MPVHDWKRVDANLFHHFHQMWTGSICGELNDGLLPKGYSALVEQYSGGIIPDVLALERRARSKGSGPAKGGAVVTAEKPKTRHVVQSTKIALAQRANRITICHPLGEVVCVIEIVSPGNKSSKSAFNQFIEKSVSLLRHGIHLLVVDLFPPTARDPQGIHKAIWDEIEEEPFELPVQQPLTLAAYSAGDPLADVPTSAYVETLAVGGPLPDMPAYLDLDSYVPVPLEATYQTAWKRCPEDMRTFVETGAPPQD
jgi:hypothetical protein